MTHRLTITIALILAVSAWLFLVVLADLTDKRLRQLEQPPTAVTQGRKSA